MPVAPSIISQPTNQTVTVGDNATFNVTASGTAPLSYQWSFGGSPLQNATNASLTLTGVTTNQAGAYAVLVTNQSGSVLSSNRSEEHTSELQSLRHLVCRLLLEKKNKYQNSICYKKLIIMSYI